MQCTLLGNRVVIIRSRTNMCYINLEASPRVKNFCLLSYPIAFDHYLGPCLSIMFADYFLIFLGRWEVAICVSDQGFQQISFVNSIATLKGGKHVDHVTDMVVKTLIEGINKKDKTGMKISPKQIKDHMWIFVGCLIENPTFDSQSKETMILVAKSFGSECELSDKFKKDVAKAGIIESVLMWSEFRAENKLGKAQ